MSECERLIEGQTQNETKLYKKRWLIALFVGLQVINVRYLQNSMGIINDIYVEYFNISYIAVDWFTIIQFPGSVMVNLLVALLIYKETVGLRRLSIAVSAMTIFTSATLFIATLVPKLYPIIYVGQFLMGAAFSLLNVTIVQMANYWFSENEIGKALVIVPMAGAIACILAFLVPSNVLKSFSRPTGPSYTSICNLSYADGLMRNNWFSGNQRTFLTYYGILVLFAVMLLCLVLKIIEDKPPKPPTNAQSLVRNSGPMYTTLVSATDDSLRLSSFFQECKQVLTNEVFILISINTTVRAGCIAVDIIFISEILRPINSRSLVTPNVLSGYIMVTLEASVVAGSFVSSIAFDHFKKHMLQLTLSLFFVFLCVLAILCGVYYQNVLVIWIFNTIKGFVNVFSLTPIRDIPVQHLHPTKPGIITALQTMVSFTGAIIIAQVSRVVLNYGGGVGVFIFISILFLFSFLVTCFVKPDLKRTHYNS